MVNKIDKPSNKNGKEKMRHKFPKEEMKQEI